MKKYPQQIFFKEKKEMQCYVNEYEGTAKLIGPIATNTYYLCNGTQIDIDEYTLEGTSFQAVPQSMDDDCCTKEEYGVKNFFTSSSSSDIVDISGCKITRGAESVVRAELWIKNLFVASAATKEGGRGILHCIGENEGEEDVYVIRFMKESPVEFPLFVMPDTEVCVRVWYRRRSTSSPDDDGTENCMPEIAFYTGSVSDIEEARQKLHNMEFNLLFTYQDSKSDMNVLSFLTSSDERKEGKGGKPKLMCPRLLTRCTRVCCLHKNPEEEEEEAINRVFENREQLQEWMNRNFVFCPPVPYPHMTSPVSYLP
jgi:hypothetical protein